MKVVELKITYELTPEDFEGDALDRTIKKELEDMNANRRGCPDHWVCRSHTRKDRMKFDANYNRYYANVNYELELK
jgi:hypothetical protein